MCPSTCASSVETWFQGTHPKKHACRGQQQHSAQYDQVAIELPLGIRSACGSRGRARAELDSTSRSIS